MIGGNCGFTLAPLEARDADYTRRMMAKVEGMPLAALEAGLPWDWGSFGEYLARLDGQHRRERRLPGRALRAAPQRDGRRLRSGKTATPEQVEQMVRLLRESLAAGGLGFSTSLAFTHSDGDDAAGALALGRSRVEVLRWRARCASTRARRSS